MTYVNMQKYKYIIVFLPEPVSSVKQFTNLIKYVGF